MKPDEKPFDDTTLRSLIDTKRNDDFSSTLETMAEMFTGYYRNLLNAGMPQEMAEELTLDYHWLFVGGMQFKDGGLPPRSY